MIFLSYFSGRKGHGHACTAKDSTSLTWTLKIKIIFFITKSFYKEKFLHKYLYFRLICVGFVDYIWAWLLAERHSTDTETLDWHCIIPNMLTLFAKSRHQIVIKINYTNKISIKISTRYHWTQLQSIYSDSNYFQSDYFQWNSSICIHVPHFLCIYRISMITITNHIFKILCLFLIFSLNDCP